MRNDNKTLADVQPGGRVRLLQAGQFDPELLWWLMDAASTLSEGGNESHAERLRSLHDALSAQPSPGGQGADLAPRIRGIAGLVEVARPHEAIKLRDIADELAARQPDTAHAAYHTGKAIGRREAELEAAARQPVGEPVVIAHRVHYLDGVTGKEIAVSPWMDGDGSEFNVIYAAENPTTRWIENAYDAPVPAQAVGLGAVRDAVQGITLGFDGDLPYIKGIAEALALIDGQAVGNG